MKDNTAAVHVQVPVEVASFLLNEKRTEIAKIELKQRINVLMVPNKTLETPNYRLERLKHDDPRLDNIEASYKMAEEIEDPTAVTRRSQEPTNKQKPVIKGVLPDAPAPMVVPKPEPARATPSESAGAAPIALVAAPSSGDSGFIRWIKGIFGVAASPPPSAAVADEPGAQGAANTGRSRGGSEPEARGGRDGERREERQGGSRRGGRGESRGARDGERSSGRSGERRGSERREPRAEGAGRDPRPSREGERRGSRGDRSDSRNLGTDIATSEAPISSAGGGDGQVPGGAQPRSRGGERRDRSEGRRERREGDGPLATDARSATPPPEEQTQSVGAQPDLVGQEQPQSPSDDQPDRRGRGRGRERGGRERRERDQRDPGVVAAGPVVEPDSGQAVSEGRVTRQDRPSAPAPAPAPARPRPRPRPNPATASRRCDRSSCL